MFLPVFVCLFVCEQDNSKSYGWIFLKFWRYVGHGISYQWFSFGHDPAGILDSGSLWNFRYHCVKGSIREPLAKRRWWRHLANSFAFAEVPAGYDCFLVMTSSMSVPIGNHFHVRPANNSRITPFKGGVPVYTRSSRGSSSPRGMKFCHKILQTLNYHTVKPQSLYYTWASISTGLWPTPRDTKTPSQNYHS